MKVVQRFSIKIIKWNSSKGTHLIAIGILRLKNIKNMKKKLMDLTF